ncbi:MAG: hypothetical protein ATN35_11945 [Epulopiscium sp. Nele67-Bin004]|nr:MAG: hypothetical protein ATN35_11945 [Epulopiscium sp. Nele67-Bin004]
MEIMYNDGYVSTSTIAGYYTVHIWLSVESSGYLNFTIDENLFEYSGGLQVDKGVTMLTNIEKGGDQSFLVEPTMLQNYGIKFDVRYKGVEQLDNANILSSIYVCKDTCTLGDISLYNVSGVKPVPNYVNVKCTPVPDKPCHYHVTLNVQKTSADIYVSNLTVYFELDKNLSPASNYTIKPGEAIFAKMKTNPTDIRQELFIVGVSDEVSTVVDFEIVAVGEITEVFKYVECKMVA